MSFEWPLLLLGLLLVPLAIGGYLLHERGRERHVARFTNPALLPNVVDRSPGWRRHLPPALILASLATLLVALARPHATVSTEQEEATVMLTIDVSRSMLARDVRPTRLVAAQRAIHGFLDRVPEDFRVGVVTFATDAQVVAPPSHDRQLVRAAIDRSLKAGRARQGRPRLVRGETAPPVAVLLLSDGAQTQGPIQPLVAAREARRLGVPIFTVALGTAAGVVEIPRPGGFRERVTVPPDPSTLRQVATLTGGRFFAAPDAEQLEAVYENLGSRLGRGDERQEVTYAFAAGGTILLLAAGALSTLWFGRLP